MLALLTKELLIVAKAMELALPQLAQQKTIMFRDENLAKFSKDPAYKVHV